VGGQQVEAGLTGPAVPLRARRTAEDRRGRSGELAEEARHVLLVGKPAVESDLRDGTVGFTQQALCPLQAQSNEVLVRRHAGAESELPDEVRRAEADRSGDVVEAKPFREVSVHELDRARKLVARQTTPRRPSGLRDTVGVGTQKPRTERAGELICVDHRCGIWSGQGLTDAKRELLEQGIVVAEAGYKLDLCRVTADELRGHLAQNGIAQIEVQALKGALEPRAEIRVAGHNGQAARPYYALLRAFPVITAANGDRAVEVQDHQMVMNGAMRRLVGRLPLRGGEEGVPAKSITRGVDAIVRPPQYPVRLMHAERAAGPCQ
jgi:hypothetical protein